jgi:hypothetical protein
MVILTMLLWYTQGIICSTMCLCDVTGPVQGVVVTDKEFQSQGMILHSVFCNYYHATSYHECSCLFFMFTRANFWHNHYICDNWWMSYHYYLCWRFSLYFRCSGWGCLFPYYGSQTRKNVKEWVLITFWFVLLYYFAKQAPEYYLWCKR